MLLTNNIILIGERFIELCWNWNNEGDFRRQILKIGRENIEYIICNFNGYEIDNYPIFLKNQNLQVQYVYISWIRGYNF